MPTKFTEKLVTKLRDSHTASYPIDHFDAVVPGLVLTCRSSKGATWFLRYRHAGQQRRLTLGKSPGLSLDGARDAAREYLVQIAKGRDPAAERKAAREKPPTDELFPALAERFIRSYAMVRNRSWQEQARLLGLRARYYGELNTSRLNVPAEWKLTVIPKSLASSWADRRANEITRADVSRAVHQLMEAGTHTAAVHRLAILKSLFGWLAEHGYVDAHPCADMRPPAKTKQRDRVLADDELVLVWRAAEALRAPHRQFIRLLLLTAQRRNEVAAIEWREMAGETWIIPGGRAKNGDAHEVHLAPTVLDELASLPRLGSFVLTTHPSGKTSIKYFSKVKRDLDAAIEALSGRQLAPWRLHDLRRTAATGMAKIGVAPHVIEAALNHRSGTIKGIARIYNRNPYSAEKREALERWATHVLTLAGKELPPAELRGSAA